MTVSNDWRFGIPLLLTLLRASKPARHSFIYKLLQPQSGFILYWSLLFSPPSPAVRMDTRVSFPSRRLLVLLCTAAALLGTRSPLAAAGRSCSDTRQVYLEKGYSTSTAPLTQISGKTVPIPQSGNKLKHTVLGTHIGQSVMIWYKNIYIKEKMLYDI